MRDDVIAIVTGSALPILFEDVVLDAAVWLIPWGGKRRAVDEAEVKCILESLRDEGLVQWIDGKGWFKPPEILKSDPQKTLF